MSQRRATILVLMLLTLVMALSFRGHPSADGVYFLRETQTLFDQGSLGREEIGPKEAAFYAKGEDGRYYGQSNEGAMIISLLPFVAFGEFVKALTPEAYSALAPPFVAALHAMLFALLAAYLLILIARTLEFEERDGWLAALLLVLATPLLHYSGRLFRDPMVVAIQLWLCLAILQWLRDSGGRRGVWLLLSFAALGWLRLPNLAVMAVVCPLVVLPKWHKTLMLIALALSGIALAYVLRYSWATSMMAPVAGTDGANLSDNLSMIFLNANGSENLTAAGAAEAGNTHWWTPLGRLLGMLISPGAGMLFYMPLVLLGLWRVWKHRNDDLPPAKLAWLIMVYSILGYALYVAWFSGSWGVRYLLPAAALPTLFAARWMRSASCPRWFAVILVAVAVSIGVLGTIVNDRPSVAHAPSHDPSVTRLDQAWQPSAFPIAHHAKRAIAADWSPIDRHALANGHTEAKAKVLGGWVVWWAVAYRAGLWWVLIAPIGMLAGIGVILWKLRPRPALSAGEEGPISL